MRTGMILALLMLAPQEARSSNVDAVVIVEKGIYAARTVRNAERPRDLTSTYTADSIKLLKSTTVVPARKGIRFGLRYVIVGSSPGTTVELGLAINFPAPGLRAPGGHATYLRSEVAVPRVIGAAGYREFHFDHDWEIVPGLWVFEFWHGDRKVGEQAFCVVSESEEEAATPNSVPECPGTPVG